MAGAFSMRLALSRVFKSLPSDLFSFIAGAVFSVVMGLATANVDIHKIRHLPLLLTLMGLSAVGFIFIVVVLNDAAEAALNDPDPNAYGAKIFNRFWRLLCLTIGSVLLLALALWRLANGG
jgi:hypothetical protein